MSMNELRLLAAKIDQGMQQLSALGISDAQTIVNRMVGYLPDLKMIWDSTSDQQLIALTDEYPGFYRYALIMEEAFEDERKKTSRPYDNMPELPEEHKQLAAELLTTAATLERGYQAFRGTGNLQVFQSQTDELRRRHRQWLSELDSFKKLLRAQGTEANVVEFFNEAFGHLAHRIDKLAG